MVVHKLRIHSYDPLRASCSCGRWALRHVVPEAQPRKVIKENAMRAFRRHRDFIERVKMHAAKKEGTE